jgi:hypothetical protein
MAKGGYSTMDEKVLAVRMKRALKVQYMKGMPV